MSRDRQPVPGQRSWDAAARADRRPRNPVLALQRAAGNRAVGQVLARKPSTKPKVTIGKRSIEVTGGNIDAWAAGEVPETLDVTSTKGRHSAELERMSSDRTRVKSL